MTIPTYLPYVSFSSARRRRSIVILYGLNRALAAAAWPATRSATRAVLVSAAVLLGWLAVVDRACRLRLLSRDRERYPYPPIWAPAADL